MSEVTEAPAAVETHCIICGEVVPFERTRHKSTTCSEEHAKVRKARLNKGDPSCKCVICTVDVSAERVARRAITCSLEHRALRKRSIRARVDIRRCRVCMRPATAIERAAFRRFRKLELSRPDLLYPAAWKNWQEQNRGDLTAFILYLENLLKSDTRAELDSELGLIDRRLKEMPGGVRSGRPRIQWTGGDPDCVHAIPTQRKDRKPIAAALMNKCRKCSAVRVAKGEEAASEPALHT